MQLIHQNYATIFSYFSVYHSIALYAVLVLFKFIIAGLLLARKIPEETPRVKPAMTTAVFIMNHNRPQANLCSVQVGSSYRGTKIYLHKLVHGSELILKLKVLHLFCSHFREFLHLNRNYNVFRGRLNNPLSNA